MADSVDSTSDHGTSDELNDPYCDPCYKNGTGRQVAGYCPKCVEFYCQRCLDTHRRLSATERHKILLGSEMPSCQADKPVKYQLCDRHDGEGKDRYCFDHSIIVCGICFVREHKQCHVKHVSDACKSLNNTAEENIFNNDVGMLLKHVKTINQSLKTNEKRLEKQHQDILKEAQEYRDKIVKQINQSYQDFSKEVTSIFKQQNAILSASQSAADQIVADIDAILQSLQQTGIKNQNDQKRFLELQDSAEKIVLCEDKIKLIELNCVDLKCTFNMNIQPLVVTNSQLGEFLLQTSTFQCGTEFPNIHYPHKRVRQDTEHAVLGSSGAVGGRTKLPVKLTRSDKITVKIADDTQNCFISGLDITADGNMFLADQDSYKIKLFSRNGQLLSSLKLLDKLEDVAVINKSEAVVSMENKQIGIIDIADSGQLSLKRIIKPEQYVWGITVYNNKMIITCDTSPEKTRSVQRIDMTGKILWTTTTDSAGNNLFKDADFLTTCSGEDGGTVIVTDWKKQIITVIDALSGKVVKVCDVKGKKPCGVTVDDNWNVYVCYDSGEIRVWSKDMERERCLVSKTEGLKSPRAMIYHHWRRELLVSSRSADTDYCDFIHPYKISN